MKIVLNFLFLAMVAALPAHADISGEELAKRQCRSVHMNFQGIPKKSKAIYAEAIAEKSAPGTYFSAANFNDGYIGFQELYDGRKLIIFSIWDPVPHGDNPDNVPEEHRTKLVTKGENARDGRFGNEGTGGQSFIDYDWKIGEVMKFLVIRKSIDDQFKQISGYYYDNHDKKWKLISCWKTHRSKDEFSRATSFVEDFRRNYESAKISRKGVYGPVFAYTEDNKWVEARGGTFTADPTPSEAVRAEIDAKRGVFSIQTGGDTQGNPDFKLWARKDLPEDVKHTSPEADVQKLIDAPLMKAPETKEDKTLPRPRKIKA